MKVLKLLNAKNAVAADVDALREHVGQLEWDGVEVDGFDPSE